MVPIVAFKVPKPNTKYITLIILYNICEYFGAFLNWCLK